MDMKTKIGRKQQNMDGQTMSSNLKIARMKLLDDAEKALDAGDGKALIAALDQCLVLGELKGIDAPVDALMLAAASTRGPTLTRQ